MRRNRLAPIAIIAGLAASFLAAAPAQAATIQVTTIVDQNDGAAPCSLREAIRSANSDTAVGGCAAGSGADSISLPAGTYALTRTPTGDNDAMSGDLDITASLVITGAGVGSTVIDADGLDRAFDIRPTGSIIVSLTDLTVEDGALSDNGGGIQVGTGTTVNLSRVHVTGNRGVNGGGIANAGTLNLSDVTISGNDASGSGGGIDTQGPVTISGGTTIAGNEAAGTGGGMDADALASITAAGLELTGNSASTSGGGINVAATATLTLSGSRMNANAATTDGGGINTQGTTTITNTTVSGNRASDDGGGLNVFTGASVTLNGVTIYRNVADADDSTAGGGGGMTQGGAGTVTIRNSILGGNIDRGGEDPDCDGSLTSDGYNVVGNSTGCTFTQDGGDQVGTGGNPIDPLLGPLADNGGPTRTHALLVGSPAQDKGSPNAGGGDACAATDQREAPRPGGSRCDSGAYELHLCEDAAVTRFGTSSADTIGGTEGDDVITTFGGNDTVLGGGGNDRICTGDGNDVVVGGMGNDLLNGGQGLDTASFPGQAPVEADLRTRRATGRGTDLLSGFENLRGGNGADVLLGSNAANQLRGEGGADRLNGRGGTDRLNGGRGRDRLNGARGKDTLTGGPGDDTLNGGAGKDACRGQGGNGDTAANCETETGIP